MLTLWPNQKLLIILTLIVLVSYNYNCERAHANEFAPPLTNPALNSNMTNNIATSSASVANSASSELSSSTVSNTESSKMVVSVGQKFVLQRYSNPSIGTEYTIEYDRNFLNLESKKTRYLGERGETGADQENSWFFVAKTKGKSVIRLNLYYRGDFESSEEVVVEIN